ncbi:Sec23/Sec24 beta-sandwich domain protein, partial [Cooperia oncophora]
LLTIALHSFVQVKRFEKILTRYLTRKIGFEAVLRIRCSRGLSLSAFYGNFFVRSTDLLALANVNPDSAIAVQVSMEEKLSTTVCFQAALLYTSSKGTFVAISSTSESRIVASGDRRIRVHTMCLPTTADLAQVYNNFDLKATVSLIAKIGVDRSMSGCALADCREAIVNAVVDSLGAYQKTMRQGRPGGLLAPRKGHLRLFPLYALAMLKHAEIGGRITVFQASIPNIGPASLKPREDPNQRAANDVQNLGPVTDFYKCLALECTGHQVALDLFLLNSQYADLATLSEMSKFSTGCVYHFPNYHCLNDTIQVCGYFSVFG